MHNAEYCFTRFNSSIKDIELPTKFTFPFYYQPHPLSISAVKELQTYLAHQTDWQHDFGLNSANSSGSGKMFGVLVVQNQEGELGYLSAFSGKLANKSILPPFVPPVFDAFTQDSFLLTGQEKVNQLTQQITQLQKNSDLAKYETLLTQLKTNETQAIETHRELMITARKSRKLQREQGQQQLSENELAKLNEVLSKQSVNDKNQLRDLKKYWETKTSKVTEILKSLTDEIALCIETRKQLSNTLQHQLFEQYSFLNIQNTRKTLNAIFDKLPDRTPPAGSGDCAAPKLLQYAFQNNMKPITMAEFWWGGAPKSEIRQHKNYYGACQGKCQPILEHMLDGIELDDNPLLVNPAQGKSLEILYQDEHMLIINKPAEFLSVPGKNITDSVYTRIKAQFVEATGPLIVHRLDMSTSGLMVIALSKRAHKKLQQQFIARTVEKRYVALIEGELLVDTGSIHLPLRVDLNDRPRQVVCSEYGKKAETKWQLTTKNDDRLAKLSRVYLYPKTGRTHQLRVHCAHRQGLNMPIKGDDLYGKKSKRLCLHAEQLALNHPITQERMIFQIDANF